MHNSNGNTSEHCHKAYVELAWPLCLKLLVADYTCAIKLWESMTLIVLFSKRNYHLRMQAWGNNSWPSHYISIFYVFKL